MTLPPDFYIGQVFVRGGVLANEICSSMNGKSAMPRRRRHKNDMPQRRGDDVSSILRFYR